MSDIKSSLERLLRAAKSAYRWARGRRWRIPHSELWFWPILEVSFIAIFSIFPLLITAASKSLKSKAAASFSVQLSALLTGGQLMYYALGFVATAAWLLFVEIRRPKWAIPFLGLIVFFVVVGVAITIGVDPLGAEFNPDAFRDASYLVFAGGLFTYLVTTILKAWQPKTLEQITRQNENTFINDVQADRKGQ